jgi:hypothetical protein
MLVLDPPNVIDFAGSYSQWVHKLDAEEQERQAESTPKAKPKAPAAQASREAGRKKVNPYMRPFGRLTLEELEQQITDTEIAIAECQESFGDAESFKDPSRGQKLQSEYESLSKKLEALEAEYFAREQ